MATIRGLGTVYGIADGKPLPVCDYGRKQNASQNISRLSSCSRIDAAIGDLRQRRRSLWWLPWPLLLA